MSTSNFPYDTVLQKTAISHSFVYLFMTHFIFTSLKGFHSSHLRFVFSICLCDLNALPLTGESIVISIQTQAFATFNYPKAKNMHRLPVIAIFRIEITQVN